MATGYFDDLIPQTPKTTAGAFDDLIPASGLRSRTPEQQAFEQELQEPTLEKLSVRAALGTGEESKGVLRVALGNALDYAGKYLHPYSFTRNRQAERGETSYEPVSTYIRSLGQATAEIGRENIQEARELGAGVGGGRAGDVIQALGTTFTVSAPAIPAAVLGGLPAAAAVAGATQFGISRGDYKDYFIRNGDDEATAERKAEIPAVIGGAITATLTRVIPGGTEMLLQKLSTGELTRGGLKQIVKRGVSEVLKEMPEEGLDQMSQGFTEKLLVNPNKSIEEIANETGFAMAAAGVMAGTTAGGLIAIGKTAEAIARPIERRVRPLGERTRNATTQRQEVDQQQRQPPPAQGIQAVPGSGDSNVTVAQVQPPPQEAIDPSTFIVSVQAPQGEVPGNVQIIDPAQTERSQSPTVESLRASGVQVPDFQTLPQGQYPYPEAVKLLQGERRSSQQAPPLTERTVPIPATPPAIEVIGAVALEQQPLMDRVLDKIQQENAATPGLPIRKVELINHPDFAVSTIPGGGGFDTVYVNLSKLQQDLSISGSRGDEFLSLVFNEEIVHNAGGRAVHDEWNKGTEDVKAATPFSEFYHQKMLAIHGEMTPDQISRTQQAYGRPLTEEGVADEFTRMLVQERMRGKITEETLGRNTVQHLKRILRKLVDALAGAVGMKRQNLQAHVNAIQSILTDQQARSPAQRFDDAGQVVAAPEPTPQPQEESPFDRMRRESGAEPAPDPTPDEQAAKERNERRRTMRPNPRFAGAASPLDNLAAEDESDVYIPTYLAGTQDNIRDRTQVTTESTTQSQQHAKKVFDEAGVPVEWLESVPPNPVTGSPSKGIWKYKQGLNEEAGRKLVMLLERELKKELTDDNVLLMGSLINSVRYNDKLGNAEGVFDLPTRRALYSLSQAQASIRGALLQELRQHPALLEDMVRNVDLVLHRVWHDAFGGEVIDGVMTDIRRGAQAFMTRPLIEHVLAQNPTLQGSLDLVTTLNENQKALPDAATLLEEIFKTPFYKLSDFGKALENRLVKEYGVDPKEAAKVAREFQNAFDPSLKQGATEALKIAMSNLTYEKKSRVKGKKSIEKLVQEAIDKGALESGEVLRKIARDNHWRPPSDDQINQMKKLSDRMRSLKSLSPTALAEFKKTGATDQEIENARKIKEEGLASEINRVRREMEIAWARMTKPISIWYGLPFFGDADIRANNARAINEFIAANLLSKPGFFTRQVAAILSQWLSFVPTRSIANAMVNNQHAANWKERQPFIKEVASQLRDGYKQQFASMKSALAAAQAGLLGRGEARSVMNLTSALSALDRLTKSAEEAWSSGNYAKAIPLYFMSSIKMGYRIAQGLDRLQGVPAHYQNMRAQVVRKLMDNGKMRADAETSADQVMGIINQEWALALVRAKSLLEEAGAKVTSQTIRQGAGNIVKRQAYQKIQEMGLPADAFEEENVFLENTLGWNQREVKGIGGALARGLRQAERVAESYGVPLVATRFSNAIGITINRSLGMTLLWKQANVGGPGESAWFRSEVDRAQRRVEAYVGTSLGAIALTLALTGTWAVRLKWPKDKEERDLFEREGHRPNTVEIPLSETEFLAISLNNSPMMFVAPYLAAGAALREKLEEKAKRQAAVDKQAAELGVTAEKVPGLSAGDMAMVALAAGQQAILGGRTAKGLIGSVTTYDTPNAKKTAASYVSAMIPWLPAGQEMSRMAGVSLDEKAATIGDLMLPLPTSGARKLNLLGDPVRTPNDIQRISQILSGGTSLVPVDAADAKTEAAYRALIESGYRPPSVNPGTGYLIDGTIRPMRHDELIRYTQARGSALKEALAGFSATGDAEQDKAQARRLYQQANTQALQSVNADPVPRYSSGSASTPRLPQLPRVTRPRSRLRRTARGRSRMRRLRTRSSRRTRGFRSVRLAA